ncbi:MAG: acetate--CoA ligase [Gammaproteobacteria bacterium]|nr:acetate--CoA ligase [Gammaproteobacteria bacterium]MCH9715633.1 acetate--CoA ligase [Gammaproteobacteria bacterium]MCH9762894.1 acetate--CoA ligase [Gammaproteobacteria bacterium]
MTNLATSYPVPEAFSRTTRVTPAAYETMYQASIDNSDAFWDEQAKAYISWETPWHTTRTGDFSTYDISWFVGGKLNACYNCVDRHLETRGHQTALIWEGNHPDEQQYLTYFELHEQVCRLANVLKALGVEAGDRVGIYLPMVPEALIAMLATARIGAVHSVVFGGFSAEALANRLNDAACKLLITADGSYRGDKQIAFKATVDEALLLSPTVQQVLVVKRTGADIAWNTSRDIWYHEALDAVSSHCEPVWMDSDAPLFILYTSGSTGKPKGILHSTGGYLVYAAMTYALVFDSQEDDIYWCTADVGWITGHSYGVYGPLANGTSVLLYEGLPNYPTPARCWEMIDRHQVTVFYTAPTALRSLRCEGDKFLDTSQRTSLRLLGSVGEPINPDVWVWYHTVVGKGRCPIVNTWWQTETGGILITPLPGAMTLEAASAGKPFFGIVPDIVAGKLVIKTPWPGMMKTVYGDKSRFITTYLSEVPGAYLTGDLARINTSGHYFIKGRSDDVIQVSGHRLGTEELESALVSSPEVSEAAVVGVPDVIKGESIYAFVTLKAGAVATDELKKALIAHVRVVIGPIATLDTIQWSDRLPKTRSGKIMRRLLRQIASGQTSDFGDVSTLAEPAVIQQLLEAL